MRGKTSGQNQKIKKQYAIPEHGKPTLHMQTIYNNFLHKQSTSSKKYQE